MQSERSTIWATSPYSSWFELASERNSWKIGFRFVTSCQFLPIISKYKWELSNPQKSFGDEGHRSPYLSHAKRVLYHLSYIPVLFKLRASFWTQSMKNWFSICNELSIPSHYQQIQMRVIESSKNVLEMRGIDPRTSRMLSERSTIWATSPYSSRFELASERNSWKIDFRFVTSCQFLLIISKYKWELSNPQKSFGDEGHRSPYLSHAKRVLYHLSYIPVLFKLRASFWTQFMKNWFSICNELSIPSHYQQIQMRVIESSKNVLEMRGIDPRTSRMLSERSTIWGTSPYSSSFELASEHNSWNISFHL